MASKVLKGMYVAPEGSIEIVGGMLLMIGEVAIGVKYRMVDIVITLQDYIKYWKICREKKSSSVSGPHFGHWRAVASGNKVVELHTMMTQIKL